MDKKNRFKKTFRIPIYAEIPITVIFDDIMTIDSTMPLSGGRYSAVVWEENSRIYVFFDNEIAPTVNTIVHECIHVKNRVFSLINHDCDRDNDEPEAYLMEYIFLKIYNIFKNQIDA